MSVRRKPLMAVVTSGVPGAASTPTAAQAGVKNAKVCNKTRIRVFAVLPERPDFYNSGFIDPGACLPGSLHGHGNENAVFCVDHDGRFTRGHSANLNDHDSSTTFDVRQ